MTTKQMMHCSVCHTPIERERNRMNMLCDRCKRDNRLAYQRRRRQEYQGHDDGRRKRKNEALLEVVSCPDDYFPRGGKFAAIDVLVPGNRFAPGGRVHTCWLPGMVIRNRATGDNLKIDSEYRLVVP